MTLILAPLIAGFLDVFEIVIGVLLSLTGLGVVLMGLIAVAAGGWRRGAVGAVVGVLLTALGFWLVGVL